MVLATGVVDISATGSLDEPRVFTGSWDLDASSTILSMDFVAPPTPTISNEASGNVLTTDFPATGLTEAVWDIHYREHLGTYHQSMHTASFNEFYPTATGTISYEFGCAPSGVQETHLHITMDAPNRTTSISSSGTVSIPFLDNLITWFDGAYTANYTLSGTNITNYADRSAAGNDLYNKAGFAFAVFSDDGLNGLDCAGYGGFNRLDILDPLDGPTQLTCFVAFQPSATGSYQPLVGQVTTPNDRSWFMYFGTTMRAEVSASGTAISKQYDGASSLEVDTTYVATMVYDAGTLQMYLNGVEDTPYTKTTDLDITGSGLYDTAVGVEIGVQGFGSCSMKLGEVILCTGVFSDTDRSSVEGYLIRKWGA